MGRSIEAMGTFNLEVDNELRTGSQSWFAQVVDA